MYASMLPGVDTPQRRVAREKANEIRTLRANLKRDLKAGRADVAAVLLEPPVWAEQMKLFDLLMALPMWGRTKVNRAFRVHTISPSKTLGGLTQRQRKELVVSLRVGPIPRGEETALQERSPSGGRGSVQS